MPRINSTLQNAIVPACVYDDEGNYGNGVRSDQFHLCDNNKGQIIKWDEVFEPILMVISPQANSAVEHMLPTVSEIGNLIGPMIPSDRGEAAVVACGARLRTLQEFTSDPDRVAAAVYAGSTANYMVDACDAAARMPCSRLPPRRRIILMIGEQYDIASEARKLETRIEMQLANITVYAVDRSWLLNNLNAPTPDVWPDPRQTATVLMPFNMPATPTTVMQAYGTEGDSVAFLPLLQKIDKAAKSILK